MPIPPCLALVILGAAAFAPVVVQACPIDTAAHRAGTALTVILSEGPLRRFTLAELSQQPKQELVLRRTVAPQAGASGPSPTRSNDQSLRLGGWLLRDVLTASLRESPASDTNTTTSRSGDTAGARGQRWVVYEAVATDGYRAYFSWGEVFNSTLAEQMLIIQTHDGVVLNAEQGPLALRALADVRSGPRHVRNLCALVARRLSPTEAP